MPLEVVTTIADVRERVARARADGQSIGLVPTMGALHDGHAELVAAATERADLVVASIFVNPMQFGPHEDLDRYPRTPEADVRLLDELGVDLVFMPELVEMYPSGRSQTIVSAGHVGTLFEGRSRPGHYDGVLTVVAKLLHIVRPDTAFFGEKDAQQLFLVTRMVRELDVDVEIVPVPIVRDADGLALSSRNVFLGDRGRRDALALSRALAAAGAASDRGVDAMLAAAQGVLQSDSHVVLDYLAIVDPQTFLPVPEQHAGPVRAIIAARVGETRLIDTARLSVAAS